MSDDDEEGMLSDLPVPVAILIVFGAWVSPVVLGLGTLHVIVRFFFGQPPGGDWLLAMVYSGFCVFYLAYRYGAFWRRLF